jgi:hypothetical protein
LFEFYDENRVISVLHILDLVLRAVPPDDLPSFASNLFLCVALGSYDTTLVKVDDQPIMPGNEWMSFTPYVIDSQNPDTVVLKFHGCSHNFLRFAWLPVWRL